MHRVILSEWTKLRTTRSLFWTTGIALFLALSWSAVIAFFDNPAMPMYGGALIGIGFSGFAMLALLVQAVMVVTTEYRFGVNTTNFALTPARWQVALSKLIVYGVFAAVFSFITIVLCYVVGDAIADNPIEWTGNPYTQRSLWVLPLTTFATVMFAQAFGWIVRHTAGALIVMIAWQQVLEPAIRFIPKIGSKIQAYAPFTNMQYFISNMQNPGPDPLDPSGALPLWQSFALFAVWAVVLYIVGLVLLEKRDA